MKKLLQERSSDEGGDSSRFLEFESLLDLLDEKNVNNKNENDHSSLKRKEVEGSGEISKVIFSIFFFFRYSNKFIKYEMNEIAEALSIFVSESLIIFLLIFSLFLFSFPLKFIFFLWLRKPFSMIRSLNSLSY